MFFNFYYNLSLIIYNLLLHVHTHAFVKKLVFCYYAGIFSRLIISGAMKFSWLLDKIQMQKIRVDHILTSLLGTLTKRNVK